jgi:hypothetical protein
MFCTECSCEVSPAASLCANCGKPLHEPGAITSTCPYAPATSKRSKPDKGISERVFRIAFYGGGYILYEGLKWRLFPSIYAHHLEGALTVLLDIVVLVVLWDIGVFDRRRR